MKVLALETSCDDTSAAIVEDGRSVLALVTESQLFQQAAYGGIVPEVASRTHLTQMPGVVQHALDMARCELTDIDAFAATLGPGLIGSLLVGVNTAKTLAWMTQKPFLAVHHLQGHIASTYLESEFEPPFLCLLVSGGHSQLIHVKSYCEQELLGETLDDAAGEAYDKIARLLGLQGGKAIDDLASHGNPHAYPMPIARTRHPYDFSFSGLKTFVSRLIDKETDSQLLTVIQADIAASFQQTVVKTLIKKTVACFEHKQLAQLTIAGGVSANSGLRHALTDWASIRLNTCLYLPPLGFCMDNAAMIGAAAFYNPISTELGAEVFSRD